MPKLDVSVKNAGKSFKVILDTDAPAAAFKQVVAETTGIPIDRMKIMVKGGILKDDTDWKKVAPKAAQQFMVLGTASELPKPPTKPVVFLEDMDESELAEVMALPVGLTNLGNTCYMNATVQAIRTIPELQPALQTFNGGADPQASLAFALRNLYEQMGKSAGYVTPTGALRVLRQVNPQFAEMSRATGPLKLGSSYAQQDADECYTTFIGALRDVPALPGPEGTEITADRFIDQYMAGEMTQELRCDEAPEEPSTTSKEKIYKLECNISISTNYLMNGIKDSLDEKIEKHSPTLNRTAVYSKHSRISRLPNNLTVHMVRFYWRRDINKKAKIMRKVKFPFELDVLSLCTDELKAKLAPVNTKLKEVDRDRRERTKIRKKTRKAVETAAAATAAAAAAANTSETATGADATTTPTTAAPAASTSEVTAMAVDPPPAGEAPASTNELEDETVYRAKEKEEIEKLIDQSLKADIGANASGLYDLCGIVTHKGASADSGHYIGYGKKDAINPPKEGEEYDDESWYKFDDDKVSIVRQEQIMALDGGGEDSVAYILIYRGRALS